MLKGLGISGRDAMRVVAMLSFTLVPLLPMVAQAAYETGNVRHVWASSLIVRAQPNKQAPEVTRLPAASTVELLPDDGKTPASVETVGVYMSENTHKVAEIVLKGHWRHIHAAQGDGWVSDVYLSRLRFPNDAEQEIIRHGVDEVGRGLSNWLIKEIGVDQDVNWTTGDSVKTDAYRLMRRLGKASPEMIKADFTFRYMTAPGGVRYLYTESTYEAARDWNEVINLPFTFNEMVLAMKMSEIFPTSANVKRIPSGTMEDGKSLKIGPAEDDGIANGNDVVCGAGKCKLVMSSFD